MKTVHNEARLSVAIDKVLAHRDKAESALLFNLGVGYRYYEAPPGVEYKAKYLLLGEEMWASVHHWLRRMLCSGLRPKAPFEAFLSGNNEREIAAWLLGLLLAEFGMTLGIAVPVAALVMKKGLVAFCAAEKPARTPLPRTLLSRKKREEHEERKKQNVRKR